MEKDTPRVSVGPPDGFYYQLGQFVMMFGYAEAIVKKLLETTAGIDGRMALALFSGTRAAEATSLIRRCHEARGATIPSELDAILCQFLILNNLRNDLLHHGIDFNSDPPVTTNARSVLNVKAVRASIIVERTLPDATADCTRIVMGVAMFVMGKDDDYPEWETNVRWAVERPWHYKPRAPATAGRQDRPKEAPRRSRKRPQTPSQA